MPLYHWKGIDTYGNLHIGQLYVSQQDELKELLLKKNIALLELYQPRESFFTFFKKKAINHKELIFFFEHLSIFLESGIDVTKALSLCQLQKKNTSYKTLLTHMIKEIESGKLLSQALAHQNDLFSPFMIHAISMGEYTGKLVVTFKRLAHYLQFREEVRAQIKKALLLPMITLIFAFIVASGLFLFVIPQFSEFFESMGKPIPDITQNLLSISAFLRSSSGLLFWMSIPFVGFLFKYILKLSRTKSAIDWLIVRFFPFFLLLDQVSFLETLELCLSTEIPLYESLKYAQNSVHNVFFQQKIEDIARAVSHGFSLNYAVSEHGAQFFSQTLIDMLAVGEQTGKLSIMIVKIKNLFQFELTKKISLFITFIQPILLIIVGIIIAGLMLALYLPIFNLANTL